ncbi:uncharacterized protein P174DRAFT_443261 [Aspergillus novofumigatus IBT 16806]|uniref:Uncharacterized protein n=1 Tax=Aspergillus novofumigatus (strain IBT 16806) TaxID=1392255 RepID=A0A2I1C6Y1_ASPN1|nr:uncharacterized protein P174DRAFT_443261 [Aspergillus novofumigatus IBT 16806]PKX93387.1 hypothetical protein P174DRAFT_443261 [Aspergillus novofumigatus IBT 16806]
MEYASIFLVAVLMLELFLFSATILSGETRESTDTDATKSLPEYVHSYTTASLASNGTAIVKIGTPRW